MIVQYSLGRTIPNGVTETLEGIGFEYNRDIKIFQDSQGNEVSMIGWGKMYEDALVIYNGNKEVLLKVQEILPVKELILADSFVCD